MDQRILEQVQAGTLQGLGAEISLGANVYVRDGFEITLVWLQEEKSSTSVISRKTPPGWEIWTRLPLAARLAGRLVAGPFRAESRPPLPNPAPVCFRLENWVDRFGKTLWINRETQTGDVAFDEHVYIETDAPEEDMRAFLTDPRAREEILRALASEQAKVVLKTDGTLSVVMRSASIEDFDHARLEEMSAVLTRIAAALPPLASVRRSVWTPRVICVALGVMVLFVGLLAFLMVDWLCPPVDGEVYMIGVRVGLALWLVSLPVLILTLRGRSTSLRDITLCMFLLLFGLPFLSVSGLLGVNGGLDGSAVVSHAATVTKLRVRSGIYTSYYATLRATWEGGAETSKEISIPHDVYVSLEEGGRAIIKTHAGALGWEWIASIKAEH